MRWLIPLCALLGLAGGACSSAKTTSAEPKTSIEPTASSKSLRDARLLAQRERKFVLVDLYSSTDKNCERLDEATWNDPDVQLWISKFCIALRALPGFKLPAERVVELEKGKWTTVWVALEADK